MNKEDRKYVKNIKSWHLADGLDPDLVLEDCIDAEQKLLAIIDRLEAELDLNKDGYNTGFEDGYDEGYDEGCAAAGDRE